MPRHNNRKPVDEKRVRRNRLHIVSNEQPETASTAMTQVFGPHVYGIFDAPPPTAA